MYAKPLKAARASAGSTNTAWNIMEEISNLGMFSHLKVERNIESSNLTELSNKEINKPYLIRLQEIIERRTDKETLTESISKYLENYKSSALSILHSGWLNANCSPVNPDLNDSQAWVRSSSLPPCHLLSLHACLNFISQTTKINIDSNLLGGEKPKTPLVHF